MIVEATQTGFFGNKRIREGQQFEIKDLQIVYKDKAGKETKKIIPAKEQFSANWMIEVSPKEAKLSQKEKVKLEYNDNETVI